MHPPTLLPQGQEAPGKIRILVIDDEPPALRIMCRLVREAGYDPVPTTSAGEALAKLEDGRIATIVSDIRMPGMDGLALLQQIRRHDPEVPVLFVTAVPTLDSALRAMDMGAFRYLCKPLDHEEFRRLVRKAVQLGRLVEIRRKALSLLGLGDVLVEDIPVLEKRFEQTLDHLWMAFQPIVHAGDGSVCGYEALLRSPDPVLTRPSLVLAAAEYLERVHELGRQVRSLTASVARSIPQAGLLFINLHPRDLTDPDLLDARSDLLPFASQVVLEITERSSLRDTHAVARAIESLRKRGFRIAIDDLGSGYASLNSFVMLRPEFVKIDMEMVRGIDRSPVRQSLVRSINETCRELDIQVVGEGVETREERDTLAGLGCDLLQGFLFARPDRPFPQPRIPA